MLPQDLTLGMINNLSKEEIWEFVIAIWKYIYEWVEPKMSEKLFWMYLWHKEFFDHDKKRYEDFCEKQRNNPKWHWRPKASFVEQDCIPSKKAKKAKKANGYGYGIDNYNKVEIFKKIEVEELRKEFPSKNIEVEFERMWNRREWNWKQIKKPNQAFKNRLLPKKRDKEYNANTTPQNTEEWISEYNRLKPKKFQEKYGYEKSFEVRDMIVLQSIQQTYG
jgi:hypothetical protein